MQGIEQIAPPRYHCQFGTFGCKRLRDGPTNSYTGAGNQGGAPFELKFHAASVSGTDYLVKCKDRFYYPDMSMKLDMGELRAFVAVAEFESFRAAAEAIHLSQTAMSRRIGKLESTLGVRLLERTTRHVSLTLAGREFARTARSLLSELDTALLHMRDVGAQPAGEISLACVSSAVQHFLPDVIRRFHRQHPRIRVRILDGSANEVLAAVLRFEADFGVNFIGTQEPEIEFQVVLEDPFVLACRDDHRLAKSKSVKWSSLVDEDFMVVTKSSGNRLILDMALAGLKTRPAWFFEVRHISALLGLAEAGLGVAAVPRIAMPPKRSSRLVGISLVEPHVVRTLGLIRRRGRPLAPAAQHLYKLLGGIE